VPAHTTTLALGHAYWWTCTCGDEGGPYDYYTEALDATVAHERTATQPTIKEHP
jgi:hypothetical protein